MMLSIGTFPHLRCIRIEQSTGTASVSDPLIELSIKNTKHSGFILNWLWTNTRARQVLTTFSYCNL
jgi:hypothetical protein